MIFTVTVVANGVEATVDVVVDENAIANTLGRNAMHNKLGRARGMNGAVVAEVRRGSRRPVQAPVQAQA